MSAEMAILTDTTSCTGCEACVEACKKEYDLGVDLPRPWQNNIDDLSATRYCTILRLPGGRSVRQQCRHCLDPACVSACLVGAMQKTPEGPVIYDPDRCMGCRYCLMACPYGVPRYDWGKPVPYVRKCTMCFARLKHGSNPACVEACPEKATIFGSREELLKEAHSRIRENPGKYQNRVFGEKEVGGTSVLYISDISLDFLACKPELDSKPVPELTWAALSKVPPLALGVGTVMTGLWWIIGRRMKLAAERESAESGAESSTNTTFEPAEASGQGGAETPDSGDSEAPTRSEDTILEGGAAETSGGSGKDTSGIAEPEVQRPKGDVVPKPSEKRDS